MRAHEVPTHVGAEDKVLLWFTFPQIVAMIATCALAYGAYRVLPFGTSEVRMGLAAVLGLLALAAIVGKIGGGRCPWRRPTCCATGWGLGATPGPQPSWPGPSPPRRYRPPQAP